MKINVKEWMAMDSQKRLSSIVQAARQNEVSLKGRKKAYLHWHASKRSEKYSIEILSLISLEKSSEGGCCYAAITGS